MHFYQLRSPAPNTVSRLAVVR